MKSTDYSDRIDQFLLGQMEPEEEKWFQQEVKEDSSLEKELLFHQNMKDAILEDDVLMMREVLDFAHQNYQQRKVVEHPSSSRFSRRWIMVAAVMTVLLATGFLAWFITGKHYSNRELYEMYFKPYKVTMNVRSVTTNQDKMMREAMLLYEQGSYKEAIPKFEKILANDEMNHAASLYSGISYMEINNYREAAVSFQRIIDHKNNLYIEQAEWYAGLCYLISDNIDKARKQFGKIASRDGYYSKMAGEVLNRLR